LSRFRTVVLLASVALCSLMTSAQAQEELPNGCHRDKYDQPMCPPPNGGIARDKYGAMVCGEGQCTKDRYGGIVCSSQVGGYATTDKYGAAVCTGGCKPASTLACQRPS
jgi:hypothetical protein